MKTKISIGKMRGLQECTSEKGTFTCLALDHRQNLRKANPLFMNDAELSLFKMDITASLADLATSVLLDPEVSAAQSIASGALPRKSAFVVAVESTGYGGTSIARQGKILPGWSVHKAKKMGASMVKLLVYYHPDSPTAHEIEAFVNQVANECAENDIGIMLEPLSYALLPDQKLSSNEKRRVITETITRLVKPGIDVLKVEFPVDVTEEKDAQAWMDACEEVSSICPTPWIVLSAAVNYDMYLRQVETACRAGASGCAVGRAVWQEAVQMSGEARLNFLHVVGRERLSRLATLCTSMAKSIDDFYYADAPFEWYKNY